VSSIPFYSTSNGYNLGKINLSSGGNTVAITCCFKLSNDLSAEYFKLPPVVWAKLWKLTARPGAASFMVRMVVSISPIIYLTITYRSHACQWKLGDGWLVSG